ncbi:MAG: DUF502 domain-containing protein [Planctomycetota bacterium]
MKDLLARLWNGTRQLFTKLVLGIRRGMQWLWSKGIVSTFLAGFFVVLPIAITIGLISWVGSTLAYWLGPETAVGEGLQRVGVEVGAGKTIAWVMGWVIVLGSLWLLGLLVKTLGRNKVERTFHTIGEQIPVVKHVYKPVVQVIDMLRQDGKDEMKTMSVVYCSIGKEWGGGILGLLVSNDVYQFAGRDCHIVYIPTSPIPMSGGIIFAPVEAVQRVSMAVENLMQIYFSIGVMSSKVIPQQYVASRAVEPNSDEA